MCDLYIDLLLGLLNIVKTSIIHMTPRITTTLYLICHSGTPMKRLLSSPEPRERPDMDHSASTSEVDMTTLTVTPPTTYIRDANIPIFKYLQKLTTNLARASHHIEFLSTSATKGITPKGLRISIEPQLPTIEGTFVIAWSRIVEDAQKLLMKTLISYWQRYLEALEKQIREAFTSLSPDTIDTESRLIREILAKTKLQETARLKSRRNNKWGDDSTKRNFGNRNKPPNRNGQSSTSLGNI